MIDDAPKGTFECPLCGFDKPHKHDHQTVRWFEEAKRNPKYDVVSQRRRCREEAEYQWREAERRREFFADPVGVLRRTVFRVDAERPDTRFEPWSGRDFAFHVMPWVIELLESGSPPTAAHAVAPK